MHGATTVVATQQTDAERAVAGLMRELASSLPLPQAAEACAELAAIVERSSTPEAGRLARAWARRLKEEVEARAIAQIRARRLGVDQVY